MKYMLLVYADEGVWTDSEAQQCYEDSTKLCHDLNAKGIYLAANPLQPIATATSVRSARLEPVSNELRRALSERIPGVHKGTIEIRPVLELPNLPTQ